MRRPATAGSGRIAGTARPFLFFCAILIGSILSCSEGEDRAGGNAETSPSRGAEETDAGATDLPVSFTVAFTGADRGVLEPCGCTKGMLGGIGRRATFLEGVLPEGCRGMIVGTGGHCGGTGPLDILRYETLLVAFGEMHYAAVALGPEELALGLDRLRAAAEIVDFPFVLTNVAFPGAEDLPFRKAHTLAVDGAWDRSGGGPGAAPRVALYGAIAPSQFGSLPKGARLEKPAAAIAAAAESLPPHDFTVVLLRGTRGEAQALGDTIASPHLVVYAMPDSEPQIFEFGKTSGDPRSATPGDRGRFVGLASVARGSDGKWAVRESIVEELAGDILPSETVRFPLDIYRERIRIEKILEKMVETKPHPSGARYVGSESCRECHDAVWRIWKGSAHSHAMATLKRVDRAYDPGCIACHTVGFGFVGGFRSAGDTPALLDVGCECCHGPASRHVDHEEPLGAPSNCTACHDRVRSPGFDRASAWAKIACREEEQ